MTTIKKIAVTGPESTGKSFLCHELAKYYQTVFVPEYARSYLNNLKRNYREEDILKIAKGQLALEQKMKDEIEMRAGRPVLFADTELIVPKIWSLHKYKHCHQWILEQIPKNKYDLFLLCDVDLPWEPDPQREHPHLRQYFFDWYVRELEHYGFSYAVVKGINQDRVKHALEAIYEHFII